MEDDLQGCTRIEQERMLIKAVDDYNAGAVTDNSWHEDVNEPFNVLLPYRPVEFTIPNTVAGLDKLPEKKQELISAYYRPGKRYKEFSLKDGVWAALSLTTISNDHNQKKYK